MMVREKEMKKISEKSRELYQLMVARGYHEDFAAIIASELNTEFTAARMIGYIAGSGRRPMEEVTDEMLAILSDRDRIVQKHISEHAQAKINEMYRDQYYEQI